MSLFQIHNLHHHPGGFTHVIGAFLDLIFRLEFYLALGRSQVYTGQLQAAESTKLFGETLLEFAYSLVAGVNIICGCHPAQNHPDSHDPTRHCAAQPTCARHPTAKTSGQAWDQVRLELLVLSDRQQYALCSIETAGGE